MSEGPNKAALVAALEQEKARAARAEQELVSFKEEVLRVALEAKEENNWCSGGFAEAMSELGIDLPPQSFTVTVTLSQTFTVDFNQYEADPEEYIKDHLLGGAFQVSMDDYDSADWSDDDTQMVSVDDIQERG